MIEIIIIKIINDFILSKMCYYTQLSDKLNMQGEDKVADYYQAMHDAYEEMFNTINRWLDSAR